MNVELINGWWVTTDSGGQMGGTDSAHVGQKQIENASNVYIYLDNIGWSLSAIAGVLGNMQLESWLSPGYIEGTHRSYLPNSAQSLSDVPNSVMINFYRAYYGEDDNEFGVGLVQWSGENQQTTIPHGQKMVSYAMRNNSDWWDGNIQMSRIQFESENNYQWQSARINGIVWTWDNFPTNTQTPEVSARIWQVCYESADPGTLPTRQANARYWYDWFTNNPPTPPHPPVPKWLLALNSNKKGGIKNVRYFYSRKL